jgi:spore maturation protein CgeB
MNIVIAGLSITSSWGNGHASTYRALVSGLVSRGHQVMFLERDVPWYAENRDLPRPPDCRVGLYHDPTELEFQYRDEISAADLVIVGSYVPDGITVADWVLRTALGCTAFYDIDTPVTLAALQRDAAEYIEPRQIPQFDIYLSFTGGPTLDRLERQFGARRARPLYCSVDAGAYLPDALDAAAGSDLGYLGTYSADRQPTLEKLLIAPARMWPSGRFIIAGPQYPDTMAVPPNVGRVAHLSPAQHPAFYNRLRFTLNVTRRDMIAAGYSPSVRLFEAAACGTPIISDDWPGLSSLLVAGKEILLANTSQQVLEYLREMPDEERRRVGCAARERVLRSHTSVHRAIELEHYVAEVTGRGEPIVRTPLAIVAEPGS